MKVRCKLGLSLVAFILTCFLGTAWAQVKRDPDIAFDTTNNRYLMVWEEVAGSGTVIKGRFRNADGTVVAGSDVILSPDRTNQGCFYQSFDTENGSVSTPTSCAFNKNPSVAFNNGQYMILWEVHGTAAVPSSAPDNEFVNVFARIVDANDLTHALPGFEEGVLISKVYLAANNSESTCGDKHVCNDGQLQAWSQAINPDVAPRLNGGGFVATWQTNKDFIGCADPARRQAWSVYGRYVDQSFSTTSTTNPPPFAVYKDDSTMMEICEPPSNVDNGTNPTIAYGQAGVDFVIAYQVARASGGNAAIGAKRVTVNGSGLGEVTGSVMPDIVANVDGSSLLSPSIVSFNNNYVLFVSDGTNIRAKTFSPTGITVSAPAVIGIAGSGNKTNPQASSNLGAGGQRPPAPPNSTPELLVLTYELGSDVWAAVLTGSFAVAVAPVNIASNANNGTGDLASDYHDFVGVGNTTGSGGSVFAAFIESEGVAPSPSPSPNPPPTAPGLLTPSDGATFAPTRAYLSWSASTDPDGGAVTYNVYFGENIIPATPQVTGVSALEFVIGPETQSVTGITLLASKTYKWKVEAVDNEGQKTSSPTVRTLNTDNSVVAWYRFDDDPAAIDCTGEAGLKTVCDYSGSNNHGAPTGGPVWLPPAADILGRALDFDGIDDWVLADNASNLNFNNGSTIGIEFRVNPASLASFPFILSKGGGAAHGNYSVQIGAMNKPAFTYTASGNLPTYRSNLAISLAVYNHVIVKYTFGNAASIRMLIGGVLAAAGFWENADGTPTATGNEPPLTNSNGLSVGRRTTTAQNYYDGNIDEVIIYSGLISNEFMDNAYLSTP